MSRVIHFEIPSREPEKLEAFYSEVFSWEIRPWEGQHRYRLVFTGVPDAPGINGAIVERDETGGFINIIDVDSVDETLRAIEAAGGIVVRTKFGVPGIGFAAYCRDPQGNLFGLMEEDMTAE